MAGITLLNLRDGETLGYRLLLIKGRVEPGARGQVLCTTGQGEPSAWPLTRGHFKCLALLGRGPNRVALACGAASKTLTVNYEPRDTDLCLTPVYIVCEGEEGNFEAPERCDSSVESALKRISFGVCLVQCIFAEKLRERGFGRKCFQLENDLDPSVPTCRVFQSAMSVEKARSMNQEELWEAFGREIMFSDIGDAKRKYLAFLACTMRIGGVLRGDAALGSGGLALLGSAFLHTWPESLQQLAATLADSSSLENICFRAVGGACHETGHMFNLGHPEDGIMARGFENTHLVFSVSHRLSPPQFSLIPEITVLLGPVEDSKRQGSKAYNSNGTSSVNTRVDGRGEGGRTGQEGDDMTHWSAGCAAILAHHKWFNSFSPEQQSKIHFDRNRNVLSSEAGLRVVQMRGEGGVVRKSWELGSKHMVLPRLSHPVQLFAIDSLGTILSTTVH